MLYAIFPIVFYYAIMLLTSLIHLSSGEYLFVVHIYKAADKPVPYQKQHLPSQLSETYSYDMLTVLLWLQ